MPQPLDYDQLLAQLSEHANSQPTTKAKRLNEAMVAILTAATDPIHLSHQELAGAAINIRQQGWQPKARPASNGVEWFLADADGNPVKPVDADPGHNTWDDEAGAD